MHNSYNVVCSSAFRLVLVFFITLLPVCIINFLAVFSILWTIFRVHCIVMYHFTSSCRLQFECFSSHVVDAADQSVMQCSTPNQLQLTTNDNDKQLNTTTAGRQILRRDKSEVRIALENTSTFQTNDLVNNQSTHSAGIVSSPPATTKSARKVAWSFSGIYCYIDFYVVRAVFQSTIISPFSQNNHN